MFFLFCLCFFFQAEDGIRDLVRSRGLGDVYKRQGGGTGTYTWTQVSGPSTAVLSGINTLSLTMGSLPTFPLVQGCLLYTSDAADERSSVDLGGRRIIKKKKKIDDGGGTDIIKKKIERRTPHSEHLSQTLSIELVL